MRRSSRRIRMNDWGSYSSFVPPEELLLAQAMKNGGYRTVGFVNNFYLDSIFGMARGYDHYQRLSPSERAADLNSMAFTWLDANKPAAGNQPLFLFMYYYDPHSWYDPPPPYDTMYDPTYTGTLTADVFQHGQKIVSGEIVPSARDIEHIVALYDGEITYWDHHLNQFLNRLAVDGLLNNALVEFDRMIAEGELPSRRGSCRIAGASARTARRTAATRSPVPRASPCSG